MKIVDTDAFLDMPQSSQLLYFHLAMRADDDGFVPNPKRVMRMIGSQDDDYKVLVAKKFILPFESGVCVIKHWLIHNLVRSDRYTETQWIKEKQMLLVDPETKKYSLNKGQPLVIPNGNQPQPQVRLGKVRLGKVKDIAEQSSAQAFSLKEYIKEMEDDSRRDINIIALYFEEKKPDIQTKAQAHVAIRRHLRAAKNLIPFTDKQILDAIPKAKRITAEWTIETLVKVLTK